MNHNDYYGITRFTCRQVAVPATGWVSVALEDADRVTLKVGVAGSGISSAFTTDPNMVPTGCGFVGGGEDGDFTLRFPSDGALVCHEWFVSDINAGGGNVWVIEAIMEIDPCKKDDGPRNAGFPVDRGMSTAALPAFTLPPNGYPPELLRAIEEY